MNFTFDLQRFDDEQAIGAEPQVSAEPSTTESAPIPEELDGIPEDIARETMAEWEQSKSEAEQAQEQPITREDYQARVTEIEQLKAQLAQYQQPSQPQPAQQPAQQPQFQLPQLKITPEISAKIAEAIKAEAMQMSGLTEDEVASLDFADDDDPQLAQWNQAKSLATNNVYGAIRQAQLFQQQQAQQFYANHVAAVNTYNEFVNKEFAEPDFKEIQQFATNDFFNSLSKNEQNILANAYIRVERQLASPAEMLVVKNYYERAKAEFRSRNAGKGGTRAKASQVVNLPRIDQLSGANTAKGVTAAELDHLLDTTEFDKLPEQYQKRLLGYI